MASKVNQDLFYQMPDEEDNKDASPEPVKDTNAPEDPMPDFGTPLKAGKTEQVVEKVEQLSD